MNIDPVFQPLATVDTSIPEYINFKQSLSKIDWTVSEYIKGTHPSLDYAPGFYLDSEPWINTYPAYKQHYHQFPYKIPEIVNARENAKPFLRYIESILNGYKIIRAELMATAPEEVNRRKELPRIHIDSKVFQGYSHRCQFAIQTNPGAFLFVEGQPLNVSDTVIYAFNNRKAHWGVNWGNELKIVLMFDIIKPEVWEQLPEKEKENFFEETPSFRFQRVDYITTFRKLHNI